MQIVATPEKIAVEREHQKKLSKGNSTLTNVLQFSNERAQPDRDENGRDNNTMINNESMVVKNILHCHSHKDKIDGAEAKLGDADESVAHHLHY